MVVSTKYWSSILCLLIAFGLGCHAEPDDAKGQAGELTDPVRRENAVANLTRLYTGALARANGDRNAAEPKAIADVSAEALANTYVANPADVAVGRRIIDLLAEMRDVRGLPALIKALDWKPDVSEEHATRAAAVFVQLDLSPSDKARVITALAEALDKVTQSRPVDNRMRIGFITALGALGDRAALPVLIRVATAQSEAQNFLINHLAAQQVGKLADASAIQPMIKGLFLFAPTNPQMRMNDVAAEALVRIGRPALQPLLELLAGRNAEANAVAQAWVDAVRAQRSDLTRAGAAGAPTGPTLNASGIVAGEAMFALGALGFPEAFDALMAETNSEDADRRQGAVLALVRLTLTDEQKARVQAVLVDVFGKAQLEAKPQLLAAMQHLYDPRVLPFFLTLARDQEVHPAIRLEAISGYALLATKTEAPELRAAIQAEPGPEDGGYRQNFEANLPALAAADECDADLSCWIRKLGDADKVVVRKAAYMLARLGRGNDDAIRAMAAKLDHREIEVRLSVLYALDHAAIRGSAEAVQKIEQLRETEQGRSIWTNFSREALPVQARLRARAPT